MTPVDVRRRRGRAMRGSSSRPVWRRRTGAVAVVVALAATLFVALSSGSAHPASRPAAPTEITAGGAGPRRAPRAVLKVGGPTSSPGVSSGFVGLALEQFSLEKYAGEDPARIDPVFEQLVRNIDPGQRPVLRLAGDSTDWDWYPVRGMTRPPWVRYTLTDRWLAVARALASGLDARLILGVNFEADSATIARAEVEAMLKRIGRSSIDAFELGNEPELYAPFGWYKTKSGVEVHGRPAGYDFSDYTGQIGEIAHKLPAITLAGPAVGRPSWAPPSQVAKYVKARSEVKIVTLHRYPLVNCSGKPIHTAAQLLARSSWAGLADSVAAYVPVARRHGVSLRIDEFNTISCRGQPGLSNSFASTLWALDALFAMAKVGVHGVNFQTTEDAPDTAFSTSAAGTRWTAAVNPLYYGLLMFARAAPPRSRLLKVTGSAGSSIQVWATRASNGVEHVLLVNTGTAGSPTIGLSVSGASGKGELERLRAPRLGATSGVTIAGQSFGSHTATGVLTGKPVIQAVTPTHGRYVVSLPAASAALVTFTGT